MVAGYPAARGIRRLGRTGSHIETRAAWLDIGSWGVLPGRFLLVLTFMSMLVSPEETLLITEIGGAHIRLTELLFVALWLRLLISGQARAARLGFTTGIRQAVWIPAAFLVSSAALVILSHKLASVSVVSALRYTEYFLLAPAAVLICSSEAQVREVAKRLRLALAAVVLADSFGPLVYGGAISIRQGFLVNPNTLGLLASGLIILSILEPYWLGKKSKSSFVYVAIGIWGLYIAHSISGVLALFGAAWCFSGTTRARWILSAVLFAGVVAIWRYGDVVGLVDTSGGTLAHREAMAYAGWRVFLAAPVFGVGWQQSTSWLEQNPDVLASIMSRFSDLPFAYFTTRGSLGVHNAYVQLLAEMGLVGTLVIALTLVAMIRRLRRRSPFPWLPLLVAVLLWHNTNPIFGGLPETALLWFAFGLAEASGKFGRRNPDTRAVPQAREG